MNDNLQPLPDEHLEARITAWVLGEASPFEAAELETLCAENPALQVFANRTKAIHSLLLETPPSSSDQFWKLSPENRAKLDPIIGPNNSTYSNKNSSVRRAAYRTAFSIAAVLTVTLFIKRFIFPPESLENASMTVVGGSEFKMNPPRSKAMFRDRREILTPQSGKNVDFMPAAAADDMSANFDNRSGDDGVVMSDPDGDVKMKGRSVGTLLNELKEKASNEFKDENKEFSMTLAHKDDAASSTPTAEPSAKKSEPSIAYSTDSGIGKATGHADVAGYGGGAGGGSRADQRDMSNTALALDESASNESRTKDGKSRALAAKELEESTPNNSIAFSNASSTFRSEATSQFGGQPPQIKSPSKAEAPSYTNEASSTTVPGVPAESSKSMSPIAGLRSGDYAVQRETVDAILNNPNRRATEDVAVLPASEGEAQIGGSFYSNSTLAQREVARRQNTITEADRKLVEGREAYAKGDYVQAADKYKEALGNVQNIPNLSDRKESYAKHLSDASLAQAQQMRKVGKYDEARELLKQAETLSRTDANIKTELSYLETPIRTSPALTYEHVEKVDQVRRDLYKAQGNYDLGKFDDAKKSYEDALRIDPHNQAARRGMEKIADAKSDYYSAAYGHSRAELLMEADKAWELAVPADKDQQADPFAVTPSVHDIADDKPLTVPPVNQVNPVTGKPKQIDITTKHVDIAQNNNQELLFKNWLLADTDTSSELDLYSPADQAKPIEFETLATGSTGKLGVPLLADLPMTGRLLQEGETGKIVGEVHTEYKSEYLFRGEVMTKQKKPSLIDLSQEISTTEEAFSTFSLNISDASFQLASAAIARGERPDPDSIKPEQFYNAVDYGDPAPSASEPVAAVIDQTAHPVIPGRNLVRVAVRTASAGRSAAQPLRLTLLVDQSGSMVRADRRAAMDTALASLATLLTENDQVTVIGFSRTPHLLAEALPGNEATKLSNLINQDASEGGTNLEQAINLATEQALRHRLDGAQNRIVLFTDGAANLGDADPDRLSNKIETLRQQGLAFDIAGIGTNDLNDKLLSGLARHGNGRYYLVGEKTGNTLAAQLAGAFRPAAENVKIQVKLNPQRVGNYKLIGFEKDRLKTEDFHNDTVDAAELAADEAGVAIYQVETLPQGTGEIGEVNIRFRDTASGDMVERKWTIPYDASAPSFDKANPKTQLATLALLAAQKLQPGPLADAIDFSSYAETIAKLKQLHSHSQKNQQLLNLINALK